MIPSKRLVGWAVGWLVSCAVVGAADSATVKLRTIELKTETVQVTAQNPDGSPKIVPIEVRYADYLKQVVLTPPAQGNSSEDVVRQIEVWEPIKKVIDSKGSKVLLNDADYQFVIQKLSAFKWGGSPDFQESIAGFVKYVRGVKEETFKATPDTSADPTPVPTVAKP